MRNAGLEEAQADCREKYQYQRYAADTTLMAESEEELKSVLMKVTEESENIGLKLNTQKTKIMASGSISSVQFSSVTLLVLDEACASSNPALHMMYSAQKLNKQGDNIHP